MSNVKSHIDQLKKLRAPWWARLLGDYRAWRKAREARFAQNHVATINLWFRPAGTHRAMAAWLHLYERGDGKRTFKFHNPAKVAKLERFSVYHHIVIPWVHHRVSNDTVREVARRSCDAPTQWTPM